MSESLLVPGEGQPFLFSELPEQVQATLIVQEERGRYTADRFLEQHPRLYTACVRLLGWDLPVQAVAQALGVSDNTVRAVREREVRSIADFRLKQGKRRRAVLDKLLDRIDQTVATADLKEAVIAYGILDDKERLDSGSPTAIVGSITAKPASDQYREWMEKEGLMIDGAIEVAPGTGLAARAGEQRGGGAAVAGAPGDEGAEASSDS